jgi:hypothetical protein
MRPTIAAGRSRKPRSPKTSRARTRRKRKRTTRRCACGSRASRPSSASSDSRVFTTCRRHPSSYAAGYAEGALFPWSVSDFSLMDAIECGIVKLPRVPVADNIPGCDMPKFRNLWDHIRTGMPKKGRGKSGVFDPLKLPQLPQTALDALYGHYAKTLHCGRRPAPPSRPCLSLCATTPPLQNSSTTTSRASDSMKMLRSHPVTSHFSAIMTITAIGRPDRDPADRQRTTRIGGSTRQGVPRFGGGRDREVPP